jgi:hypothetical protein
VCWDVMGWGGYLGFFWCLMLWGFCLLQDMFLNDDFANQIFFSNLCVGM